MWNYLERLVFGIVFYQILQVPNNKRNTIALQNQLCITFHNIHLVIQLVSITYTNHKSLKVPFKTQPIAFGY
jgi:hypothetical protein